MNCYRLQTSKIVLLILVVFLSQTLVAQQTLNKVACVGNSITYGYGLSNPKTESYPAQLQALFDPQKWMVENFGISSRTMLKTGDLPYWNETQYNDALAFNPNYVIIKLGTNDSKRWIWNKHGSEYKTDYKEMIQSFRNLPSKPEIWIALLIPGENKGWDIYNSYVKDSVNPKIKEIALETGVGLIDLYSALNNNRSAWLLGDSVHPTKEGSAVIAKTVKAMLTKAKPELKYSKRVLIAPKAEEYQWYCDRVMVAVTAGGTSREFKPTKSGLYKVSVKLSKQSESRIVSQDFLVDTLQTIK